MYQVGLIGVSGYTGMELARILASHQYFELSVITSRQECGKKLSQLYPFLLNTKCGDLEIVDAKAEHLVENCDLIFLAVPHQVAMENVGELLELSEKKQKKIKIIDLSADFRIKDSLVYEKWYAKHLQPNYLSEAVYGLPELYTNSIKNARLVANPGCYPTASILALYPAIKHKLIDFDNIIIDAKSGTSGAGRKASVPTLFCEVQDNFRPYNIGGKHRHIPEIEQELSLIANQEIILSFNPHLIPLLRGILATIYAKLSASYSLEEIHNIYTEAYKDQPFVRVLPINSLPETRNVRSSMYCDIAINIDERTKQLILTSAIDNLARGASMQAIANANLMFGLNLETNINYAPLCP